MASRIEMKLDLLAAYYEFDEDVSGVFYEMTDSIADSIHEAYCNSVDFESDTVESFKAEIGNVFNGLYGEFKPDLSSVIEMDNEIVGGLLLCIFRGEPTVTYLFTNPKYQRKNFANKLLSSTCYKLLNDGYKELYVYLNLKNIPAYNLFDKFGFNEIVSIN